MAAKQEALSLLASISTLCSASKAALGDQSSSPQLEQPAPTLPVLRKDFISILTLLYTLTTKISLTLRTSEAAYSASLSPLKDTAKYISSLTTCAALFDIHGRTLSEEVKNGAKDVLESFAAFANAFIDIVNHGEASKEDYLVKTGEVHGTITVIRQNLSEDNLSAVRKRWSTDRRMLEDSLADVQAMVEDDEEDADEDEGEDDGFDDDLDMLGLGPTKKMSPEELDRTKKIHSLLRIIVLLHKRILLDILKSPSHHIPNPTLDKLPPHSHSLLLAMEEVVAALYAPQDVLAVHASITAIVGTITQLRPVVLKEIMRIDDVKAGDIDAVTKKMEETSLIGQTTQGSSKEATSRKWFSTCFGQIAKSSQTVLLSLDVESRSSS